MSPESIKPLLWKDPFVPLRLRLTDGTVLRIVLPGELRLGPQSSLWVAGRQSERLPLAEIAEAVAEPVPEDYLVDDKGAPAMTTEKFDEFLKRRPFVPFTIHTADGERFEVKSPEFASRTQAGRTIFVSTGGERTDWIDLLLVVRLSSGVENSDARSV